MTNARRPTSPRSPRASATGRANWASARSASPTSTSATRRSGSRAWLDAGRHGTMDYMERHAALRAAPGRARPRRAARDQRAHRLLAGRRARRRGRAGRRHARLRVALRARPRLPQGRARAAAGARRPHRRGDRSLRLPRVLRQRAGDGGRVRREGGPRLARQAHARALARRRVAAGSWARSCTDLPLPPSEPVSAHCGSCTACIDACPTGAIVAPYELDARRCISYLTIELDGAIPEDLRPLVGNRVYGCDDCQLACPWNRYAQVAALPDFARVRHGLDDAALVDLFAWTRAEFETRMAGSAILRIGYERWSRNLAVALGNAPTVARDRRGAARARRRSVAARARACRLGARAACRGRVAGLAAMFALRPVATHRVAC